MNTDKIAPVRVRVAPSPTGHMHLATARTALYDYLLAKKTGGKFILRIEDTDVKRTVAGSEQEIMAGLRWLGLDYDEGPDIGGPYGPYRQTERRDVYEQHALRLLESGHAYRCFCTPDRLQQMRERQQAAKMAPHYDGTCRVLGDAEAKRRAWSGERFVVRFKMPKEGNTIVRDLLRGEIVVENRNIDDYVLLKSDGLPTYHLAAMVDDHLMQITHVLRGAEWLSTLPVHANVIRAFGWEEPEWVHLSLFLKPSGKGKLSKRDATDAIKDGYSVFIKDLEGLGFTPEGVLNWIVLMGWGVAEDDVLTKPEMAARFSLESLTASPAAINFAKLDHFNGTHIRRLRDAELAARIKPFFERAQLHPENGKLRSIAPLLRERMATLDESVDLAGFFFRPAPLVSAAHVTGKGMSQAGSAAALLSSCEVLESLQSFEAVQMDAPLRELAAGMEISAGQLFTILREAVTGQRVSPPLLESMEILGRAEVLARIRAAAAVLVAG